MPFKSEAQRRWMHAAEARGEVPKGTASRWEHHTKNKKDLPEYVAEKRSSIYDVIKRALNERDTYSGPPAFAPEEPAPIVTSEAAKYLTERSDDKRTDNRDAPSALPMLGAKEASSPLSVSMKTAGKFAPHYTTASTPKHMAYGALIGGGLNAARAALSGDKPSDVLQSGLTGAALGGVGGFGAAAYRQIQDPARVAESLRNARLVGRNPEHLAQIAHGSLEGLAQKGVGLEQLPNVVRKEYLRHIQTMPGLPKQANEKPWEKDAPAGKKKSTLTDAQKDAARRRAAEAGRPYPNLIDNMWASGRKKQALDDATAKLIARFAVPALVGATAGGVTGALRNDDGDRALGGTYGAASGGLGGLLSAAMYEKDPNAALRVALGSGFGGGMGSRSLMRMYRNNAAKDADKPDLGEFPQKTGAEDACILMGLPHEFAEKLAADDALAQFGIKSAEVVQAFRTSKDGRKKWRVSLEDGKYSCTCPDYMYRHAGKDTHCKHIKQAIGEAPVKTGADRFSTFLRTAPLQKVLPAVEAAVGSATPSFYKDTRLNSVLQALRTGAVPDRDELVRAIRQRLKGGFPSPLTKRLSQNRYDRAFGKNFRERVNSPLVKVYHGGVHSELENMLKHGPNGAVPTAPGIGGRNELAGAFVHTSDDPLAARALEAYGQRRAGYAGGTPAYLEAEFPRGLLSERGRLGGGESVIPRSLWRYLQNPKIVKTS